ncbi:MAG: chromosomal replication initiator protein DnaA [Bacteroidales bacterium]|jgi:chromosomal replication initiator protein|nr:chromosomal replication initiator protein DnaA [Bacteroidales bacterium]
MSADYRKIWENCLKMIKDNVNPNAYEAFFKPIKPVKLEGNVLTIQVRSMGIYEWLESKFINILKKTIKSELGPDGRLEYQVLVDQPYNDAPYMVKFPASNNYKTANNPVPMPLNLNGSNKEIPNPFIIPGLKKLKINSQLNKEYSFENFVEGECNRLARSAGWAIAENPGKTAFNPFYLHSKTGMGKTHLSQAIGLEIKNLWPETTVSYVDAERFMHQFVDATQNKSQTDFINFYQMIDVLIIDDIHFLAGREKTQDVFFHIFNHLHQNRKQLILTSDRPPVELKGIEERLISRFKWGLATDLQMPDVETRKEILRSKSYKDGIEMPEEIVDYLAKNISNNIRELEGARISLMAQASLNKKEITLDLAKQMIDKFVINTSKEISIEYIQKVVCEYFNLSLETLNSKTRKREIVQARQLVMYFAKEHTKSSLALIGMHCGNKDHATVLHAVRTVNNLVETDKQFRGYYKDLEKRIKIK